MKKISFSTIYMILIYVFILTPFAIIFYASFSDSSVIAIPPRGISLRWYTRIFVEGEYIPELITSLILGGSATLISSVLGFFASLAIVRYDFPGKHFISSILLAPLMIPVVLLGVALLQFYSITRLGLNFRGMLLGHIVMTLPYTTRTITSALAGFNQSLEEAAMNLGCNFFQALVKVTVPVIMPGIISGAMFAFIISLGDSVLSLFVAGANIMTLPVKIFTEIRWNFSPGIAAISALISILSLTTVVLIFLIQGASTFVNEQSDK